MKNEPIMTNSWKRAATDWFRPARVFGSKVIIGALLATCPLSYAAETTEAKVDYAHPALNPVTFLAAPTHAPVTLAGTGVVPVIMHNPDVTREAKELAAYMQRCTGVEPRLAAANEAVSPDAPLILIGKSKHTEAFGIKADDLTSQEFLVQSFPRGIAIVGGDNVGLQFGVSDFIERFLGVRWYYPGEDGTIVPTRSSLIIYPVAYRDKPVAIRRTMWPWRAPGFVDGYENLSKSEMDQHPIFEDIRRHYRQIAAGVPFDCHVPNNVGMHFEEYPETFELSESGKRNNHNPTVSGGMPCYSHPDTLKWHVGDLERFFANGDKRPWEVKGGATRGTPRDEFIFFSPPDKPLGCECERCQVHLTPEKGRWGSYSDVFGHFVEGLSREIKQRWPEKTLSVLPYQNFTIASDAMRLSGNVRAQVCLMHGIMPMQDPRIRAEYDRWIEGWRRATAKSVYVWEYLCWPGQVVETALSLHYPHTLKKFYMHHNGGGQVNIEGSFINGGAGPSGLPGAQWAARHPDIYCHFRLLWNPRFNVDAMMDEYVRLMYGPAQVPMKKLFDHLAERCERHPWKEVPKDWRTDPATIHEETMPWEEALKLQAHLAEARCLAGEGNVHRRRVDFYGNAIDMFMKESALYHGKMEFPPLADLAAPYAAELPFMDGRLDEAVWKKVKPQPFRLAKLELRDFPENQTTARAVWNDEGVVLGLEMAEPAMDKLIELKEKHTISLHEDNSIEVFVTPPENKANYTQIIFNSLGYSFAMRTQDGKAAEAERSWKLAVHKDKDQWTAELFIPFSLLCPATPIVAGTRLPVNIIRNRHLKGLGREKHSLNTRYAARNNDPDAFSAIVLEASPEKKAEDDRLGLTTGKGSGKGWGFYRCATPAPGLPRVLLIGDSIVNGYRDVVRRELAGKANVDTFLTPAAENSPWLLNDLKTIITHTPYAVVHFNLGLHGWPKGRIPDGQYEPVMRKNVAAIREFAGQAKLVWASSTPITEKDKPTELDPVNNPTIVERNGIAAIVMKDNAIPVNDLYGLVADKLDLARGDRFHWTNPAYELMGRRVAQAINGALAEKSKP